MTRHRRALIDKVVHLINNGLEAGSESNPSKYWEDGAHLPRENVVKLISVIKRELKKEEPK